MIKLPFFFFLKNLQRYLGLLLVILLVSFGSDSFAGNRSFSDVQICKATISSIMGRDPRIIQVDRIAGDIIYLSYIRPDDGRKWAYRLKLQGNRVIWASDVGRWRNSEYDSKIVYSIAGDVLSIEEKFSDGSKLKKSYSFSQLK